MKLNKSSFLIAGAIILWCSLAIVGRIIPQLPNINPLTALAILSGYVFEKKWAITITLFTLTIADVFLGLLTIYPIFGDWSLFTYSGFICIAYFATRLRDRTKRSALWEYTLFSTLGYWLWTNFGTWIMTDMYTYDVRGFFECYLMALPYLRNALIGNILYLLIFLPGAKKLARIMWERNKTSEVSTTLQ